MRALTNRIADIFSPNDNDFYYQILSHYQVYHYRLNDLRWDAGKKLTPRYFSVELT